VNVRAGGVRHECRLGVLMLERELDRHELELLVSALERAELEPRYVVAAELDEGGARFELVRWRVVELES
jgi:hypothetical protein